MSGSGRAANAASAFENPQIVRRVFIRRKQFRLERGPHGIDHRHRTERIRLLKDRIHLFAEPLGLDGQNAAR